MSTTYVPQRPHYVHAGLSWVAHLYTCLQSYSIESSTGGEMALCFIYNAIAQSATPVTDRYVKPNIFYDCVVCKWTILLSHV